MNNKNLLEAFIRIHDKFKILYNKYIKLFDPMFPYWRTKDAFTKELELPSNKKMLRKIRTTLAALKKEQN